MRSLDLQHKSCEASARGDDCPALASEKRPAHATLMTITPSRVWVKHFQDNANRQRAIPWERGAEVTSSELAAVAASLRAWQLGETSDGSHLLSAAGNYASKVGDPDFLE